jgi:hypothetical protein
VETVARATREAGVEGSALSSLRLWVVVISREPDGIGQRTVDIEKEQQLSNSDSFRHGVRAEWALTVTTLGSWGTQQLSSGSACRLQCQC